VGVVVGVGVAGVVGVGVVVGVDVIVEVKCFVPFAVASAAALAFLSSQKVEDTERIWVSVMKLLTSLLSIIFSH